MLNKSVFFNNFDKLRVDFLENSSSFETISVTNNYFEPLMIEFSVLRLDKLLFSSLLFIIKIIFIKMNNYKTTKVNLMSLGIFIAITQPKILRNFAITHI